MTESPKKGRRRKGCIIPAASILLIVSIFIGREVWIAFTATPGSSVDYRKEIVELVDSFQSGSPSKETIAGDNGWNALVDAIDAFDAAQAENENEIFWTSALITALDPKSHDPERDEFSLDAYLDTANNILLAMETFNVNANLDRLALAARFTRPLPSRDLILFEPFMELGNARTIGRSLAFGIRRSSEHHDDAQVIDSVNRGFALGNSLARTHVSLGRLVGIAVFALTAEELRAALADHQFNAQDLDQIAQALSRHQLPPLRLAIEGERINMLDAIQGLYTDDGHGSGRLIASRINLGGLVGGPHTGSAISAGLANLVSLAYPSKRETVDDANALFDLVYEDINCSRQERVARVSPHATFMDQLPKRQVTLRLLAYGFDEVIAAEDLFQAYYAGTRIMVAIEQFNARSGNYPKSLDDLVPKILPDLPKDPFASDGQFKYRILEPNTDPLYREYTLYSVGDDQTDNDGIIDYEHNMAALGLNASGYDFIFNLPRPKTPAAPTPADDDP